MLTSPGCRYTVPPLYLGPGVNYTVIWSKSYRIVNTPQGRAERSSMIRIEVAIELAGFETSDACTNSDFNKIVLWEPDSAIGTYISLLM